MKKVILNKCFGGFDVSPKAYQLYAIYKGYSCLYKYQFTSTYTYFQNKIVYKLVDLFDECLGCYVTKYFGKEISETEASKEDWEKHILYLGADNREDDILIKVVEELGDEASGRFGELIVVEIPDDLDYIIDNYDGIETLHARVETW